MEDTRQLRDRPLELGVEVCAVSSRNNPPEVGQVAVSTPIGLAHTPLRIEWRDLVLVPNVAGALGKDFLLALSSARRARLIGLEPFDARPSPLERDQIRSFFGFQEVSVPYHGTRDRCVQVAVLPIVGGPKLTAGTDGVTLQREGIWRHELRNRKVAQVALAAGRGGAAACHLVGIDALPVAPGVVVLAANVEQALALARRLPGWRIFPGPNVYERGLGSDQRRLLHQSPNPCGPTRWIVTAAALPDFYLNAVDVLDPRRWRPWSATHQQQTAGRADQYSSTASAAR